ncbi:MAG: F0F1 ATP synthase subunit delta [Candidatus Limnocylindrales bacterium]
MLIDPFTLIVQIINFAILLVALKFVLFDRIVGHMDERQARLAEMRDQAHEEQEEAEEKSRELERRLADIEREREDRLAEAREDARERRQELIEEARGEVEEQRDRWRQALADEREQMMHRIRTQVGEQVLALTRRVLADLADAELRDRYLDIFERRIEALEPDERDELRGWISDDGQPVVVSAAELDDDERDRLRRLVHDLAEEDVDVDFRRDDGLIGGLEIQVGGRAFGWTVDGYLEEVGESLRGTIGGRQEEEGAGAAAG